MPPVVVRPLPPLGSRAALSRTARGRDCSESDLIRAGIERVVEGDDDIDMAAAIGQDVGVGHGPRDLSSSRKRMGGYGRARHH